MTDGKEYLTRSTWGKEGSVLRLETDSASHPAWKGGQKHLKKGGRLDLYKKKFGNIGA